jgi:L-ascorbate metabolism protein UlaG (beta-lactamase superfamily)
VAVDPYLTRSNLPRQVLGHLTTSACQVDRYLPKVDLILVGHSHADHLADVAFLARRDDAQVVGTLTTARILAAQGVPDAQVHVVGPGDRLEVGGVLVHAVRGAHAPGPGGTVPFPGVVEGHVEAPLRASQYREEGVLFYRVLLDGVRVGHLSSAGVPRSLPGGLAVDVLLAATTSPFQAEPVAPELVLAMQPTFLVPIHFDLPFLALEADPRTVPGRSRDLLEGALSQRWPGVEVVVPRPMEEKVLDVRARWACDRAPSAGVTVHPEHRAAPGGTRSPLAGGCP